MSSDKQQTLSHVTKHKRTNNYFSNKIAVRGFSSLPTCVSVWQRTSGLQGPRGHNEEHQAGRPVVHRPQVLRPCNTSTWYVSLECACM